MGAARKMMGEGTCCGNTGSGLILWAARAMEGIRPSVLHRIVVVVFVAAAAAALVAVAAFGAAAVVVPRFVALFVDLVFDHLVFVDLVAFALVPVAIER